MVSLGGIIHPRTFQITDLIGTMAYVFRHESGHQTTRYKNLELGVWGDVLASNDRKSVWAMIDGSIYNALKLKAELKNKGYHFNSDTAAELIIHAYDAWKEEFMPRLNGDFAIALFDEEKETLYIIRDRLGKKNLYWSDQGEYWLFSTEIKGLLSTGGVPQTTSLIGLSSYLTFGFIPQDMSPIKGANKLLPAHYLKINLSRQISIGQYWSYSQHFANKSGSSKQKIYENFGRWFEDAIRISIPQNKEIGVFLLNSLGSAAMTWHLCHFMPRENIHAFSTVDEKNQIESISKMMSLSPHFVTLDTNEVLNELVKIIWYLDEPIADLQLIRTWFLAKAARQTCTIIYADMGWSELFAGKARYFESKTHIHSPHFAYRLSQMPEKTLKRLILPFFRLFQGKNFWRIIRNIDINQQSMAYLIRISLLRDKERKKISPLLYRKFDPEIFTQRFHRLTTIQGRYDPFLYFDAKTSLPDSILTHYERLLAPYSLKLIAPFLDHRLVQFMAAVPESIKCEKETPGIMLRNYLNTLCPPCPEFPESEDPFVNLWRSLPEFREIFRTLEKGLLVEEGLISAKWIRHQLGYPYLIPSSFRQLWALLCLEIWFRLYINKPITESDLEISVKDFLK